MALLGSCPECDRDTVNGECPSCLRARVERLEGAIRLALERHIEDPEARRILNEELNPSEENTDG